LLGSLHELSLDIINPDEFATGDTLLKNLDKFIFVLIVIADNFGLNRAEEEHDGNVNSRDEEENDKDGVLVR